MQISIQFCVSFSPRENHRIITLKAGSLRREDDDDDDDDSDDLFFSSRR
jgi:hypothetical protein